MSNELNPNKENMVQFNVRIPEFVKKIMEKAGKLNSRSQNQEAIYRLNNFTSHEAMIQEIRNEMNTKKFTFNNPKYGFTAMCMMVCCCKVSLEAHISYGL